MDDLASALALLAFMCLLGIMGHVEDKGWREWSRGVWKSLRGKPKPAKNPISPQATKVDDWPPERPNMDN